jgi:hypothetical protein
MTPAGISLLTSIYLGLFVGGLAFFWLWEDGAPLKAFADERDQDSQPDLVERGDRGEERLVVGAGPRRRSEGRDKRGCG